MSDTNPILTPLKGREDEHFHTDNGFSSFDAMCRAHDPIIWLFQDSKLNGRVIDLGCGNGRLLNSFKCDKRAGMDLSVEKVNRGKALFPDIEFIVGDMFHRTFVADIAILMPGRILEKPEAIQDYFISYLRSNVPNLIVYAYGDWIKGQNIEQLAKNARLIGPYTRKYTIYNNPHSEAAWLTRS